MPWTRLTSFSRTINSRLSSRSFTIPCIVKKILLLTTGAFITYLNNQVFESSLIFSTVRVEITLETLSSSCTQILNALIALLHLLETHRVSLLSDFDLVLNPLSINLLFELLLQLDLTLSNELVFLLLVVTLSFDHDLKGFLMSILAHHTLQLERVCI